MTRNMTPEQVKRIVTALATVDREAVDAIALYYGASQHVLSRSGDVMYGVSVATTIMTMSSWDRGQWLFDFAASKVEHMRRAISICEGVRDAQA